MYGHNAEKPRPSLLYKVLPYFVIRHVSLHISNNPVGKYVKFHKHIHFGALVCLNVSKQCNIHVNNNNPHNKIQRKILLDITLCKQCTFHVNNSILNQHTL